MICRECGARSELRDCTEEEMQYKLCSSCIAKLREKNELPDLAEDEIIKILTVKCKKVPENAKTERMYTESEIREAVSRTSKKYQKVIDKMNFYDIVLIENVLAYFEIVLFNGDVQKEVS